jgi:hypothetical protein
MSEQVVFRGDDGRVLTTGDLEGLTGAVGWELVGANDVPREATLLHQQARALGQRGLYHASVRTCTDAAAALAPNWPYPLYDRAFTKLLIGQSGEALKDYEAALALSPRGFFTCITAVDALQREARGELAPGTYFSYLSLEWIDDKAEREAQARVFCGRCANFAPGWKTLSSLVSDPAERMQHIEKARLLLVPCGVR